MDGFERLVEACEASGGAFERAGEGGGGRQGFARCRGGETRHHRRRLSALRFRRRQAHASLGRAVTTMAFWHRPAGIVPSVCCMLCAITLSRRPVR